MKLTQQIRGDSGYAWVTSRLDTVSPFGYALGREPRWYGPGSELELEAELDRIARSMDMDGRQTDALVHQLSDFRDIRNSFYRAAGAPMDVVELFEVKHFLLTLERLAAVYAGAPLAGIEILPGTELLNLLDPGGRRLPAFSVESAFEPSLERIRREKKQVEQEIRAEEGDKDTLLARRRELVKAEDGAEFAARRRLTDALLKEREFFFSAMDEVGRLDLVLAKAKLARKLDCTRPVISNEIAVTVTDMVHPKVAEHLEERGMTFTPVSVELVPGTSVVTGANMGGKSVSLKTVTLNLLLMHTGFFVFAGEMRAPLFHSVNLICSDGQSVEQGLSSFGAEVWSLNELLKREEGNTFFLALDEFARGTNPREGAALAGALVRHLNSLSCVAMLTTHYDGVSEFARRHYQVAGLSGLTGREGEGAEALDQLPRLMDYHLIPAPPDAPCPRDAMRVCRLLGLDEKLMDSFVEFA